MATLLADWSIAHVVEFRNTVGLSQQALAERVGLARPTLAKIEDGGSTKQSTINFLVTRLREEFGDRFEQIGLVEMEPNRYDLRFVRKASSSGAGAVLRELEWESVFDSLSRKIIEACAPRNRELLPLFDAEFRELLEAYERLSGLSLLARED